MSVTLNICKRGHGPRLVLLHGWGMNGAIFNPLIDYLKQDFEIWNVDLPGHGRSGLVELAFDQQLEVLAQALPSAILLGWSMGGLYATELAHRYPEKFSHVLLVASNPRFVQEEGWESAVSREVFDEFAESLSGDWKSTIKRFVGLQLHGADQACQLIRHVTSLLYEGGEPQPLALRKGLELLLIQDARDTLKSLQQPVMLVLGRRDTLVPISLLAEIHKVNPMVRVECFPHSAHVPFVSHPQQFADLLREFTQSSSPGQNSR